MSPPAPKLTQHGDFRCLFSYLGQLFSAFTFDGMTTPTQRKSESENDKFNLSRKGDYI
jgi:hypothetical protein